uniref:Uncharacterized protein n=1 Tax=Chromera velia CCMP2878 TaxID=1169474 RepID=A0A0G4IEC3_9ALVE|eukprot:Cvel_13672.t1-p1 / transcript=Cvel_13672.t1 / gene=Cvel_13672 / organism=Chromera_velia_CCMP2878 / gene_product=hypothetical protein / transcript_product=hypothetical protein / location=Cvel_scaffold944:15204-16691(+) / protein_length=304 / sequence_SO=supercontig / SO=protein_coding / is_pseudo=false
MEEQQPVEYSDSDWFKHDADFIQYSKFCGDQSYGKLADSVAVINQLSEIRFGEPLIRGDCTDDGLRKKALKYGSVNEGFFKERFTQMYDLTFLNMFQMTSDLLCDPTVAQEWKEPRIERVMPRDTEDRVEYYRSFEDGSVCKSLPISRGSDWQGGLQQSPDDLAEEWKRRLRSQAGAEDPDRHDDDDDNEPMLGLDDVSEASDGDVQILDAPIEDRVDIDSQSSNDSRSLEQALLLEENDRDDRQMGEARSEPGYRRGREMGEEDPPVLRAAILVTYDDVTEACFQAKRGKKKERQGALEGEGS